LGNLPSMTSSDALGAPRSDVEVETRSAAETRSFAAHLATVATAGDRIALIGPLGAGKTQFAKGFAVGLGVTATVNSPSFTLMAEYAGRLPLFHQDLYRLAGSSEALEGGLLDERQTEGVTLSEWAERLDAQLDADRLEVRFSLLGDEERTIRLVLHGGANAAYLGAARSWSREFEPELAPA
jgi:tRNA threonylcarbamoyladenosine biosynthesis protein TsaE